MPSSSKEMLSSAVQMLSLTALPNFQSPFQVTSYFVPFTYLRSKIVPIEFPTNWRRFPDGTVKKIWVASSFQTFWSRSLHSALNGTPGSTGERSAMIIFFLSYVTYAFVWTGASLRSVTLEKMVSSAATFHSSALKLPSITGDCTARGIAATGGWYSGELLSGFDVSTRCSSSSARGRR